MNEELIRAEVDEALHEVLDPETGVNLVDLGLILGVALQDGGREVEVTMTFTTPACPAGDVMIEGVERRLSLVPGVGTVRVNLTFEPRWTPDRITEEGRRQLG